MNTRLRWSPTRKFHFHHDIDALFQSKAIFPPAPVAKAAE